jgi:beta-glucanase (GH16 family)
MFGHSGARQVHRSRLTKLASTSLASAALVAAVSGCNVITNGAQLGAAPAGQSAPAPSAALAPTDPQPAAATGVSTTGWALSADDEFNGSSLNTRLWSIGEPWNYAPGFVLGDDAYCPLPQNGEVTEGNGALHLNAIGVPSHGKPLQSCFITTRNKFSFTHGYVEARVKIPSSPGLWSAFWLLGNGTGAQGWPKTGEIDLFEVVNNGKDDRVPYFTVHWGGNCPDGHCSWTQNNPYPKPLAGPADRWVTYGMKRTADSLTIYIDGKQTLTVTRTQRNPQNQQLGDVLFNSPMHIRFDLSAGGWAKNPASPSKPGSLDIDYLRVWS